MESQNRNPDNRCARGLFALLFELVGTFLLVYTIMAAYNNAFDVILVLSILNVLGYRISAAHFNPAITFASLFKRNEDRFERRAALFYILFQCCGAFAGALFGLLEDGNAIFRMRVANDDKIFQAILIEILGTFVYVLLHMIGTDYSTRLSQDDLLNSFTMAAALGAAIVWGKNVSGACYNPAVGLFINLIGLFNSGKGAELEYVWIYLAFPFVGALLSVLFHEFIFKKALIALGESKQKEPLLQNEE